MPDFAAGLALLAQDRTAEAIDLFEKIIVHDPKHLRARHALGLVQAKSGNLDEAVHHLRFAADLDVDNTDIRAALIQFLSRSKM